MEKEMIINATPTEVEIALMENGRLVELHYQKTNSNFSVGDVFLGKVQRLMPGLNAAFVDIGHKKDAFLHYTDLGPKLRSLLKYSAGVTAGNISTHKLDNFKLEPEIVKTGKVDQVLEKRQNILVQILKEPISTKGPRLSCEVTIPGRYLVLTPFNEVVAVSKKIGNAEERKRLQNLVESIRPKNFGVIVRTAAEGKKTAELHEELAFMMSKWEDIYQQMYKATPPAKLLSELDKTSSILRDLLTDSFNRIVVNDKELFQNIKNYLATIAPDQIKILSLHKGSRPIFETFSVDRQIKASFGKTATLSSGAYLVIESTEALHVVDVNSGHKMSNAAADDAILNVNLEAAEEIARQLRLRDIGGIIIIDFIDMKNPDHKKDLHLKMREFMKKDRAQHTVLPLSKFGLMQITRQRVRPEVKINTAEVCPTCNGSGKINASVLLMEDIQRDLDFVLQSQSKAKLTLSVHPYIEAYLKRGFFNQQIRWFRQYFRWIKIKPSNQLAMTQYKFYDEHNDEIRLS
ncbi:MAG: Rne/Rng family ribonuclease [Saprospiraceae bacterium]|nr:Rne/Rng family ribonuclease [Saprospiraceae bacterium]HRJ13758.1 Rne/Rng family ribonuclease [Saprospiraceae bacterium]